MEMVKAIQTDSGGDGCLSLELSTVIRGTNGGCAVLISYMALAEDEEIGRSEKDPSLGEEEEEGKKTEQQEKKAVTQACRGENVILTPMLLLHYTQRYKGACASHVLFFVVVVVVVVVCLYLRRPASVCPSSVMSSASL